MHGIVQVQKLQSGNARLKEQHSLAEENLRSLHARQLSAKEGDIRVLQERCDDAMKQNEVQRTDAAAKVCATGLAWNAKRNVCGAVFSETGSSDVACIQ